MTFIQSRIEEMLRCKEKEKYAAFMGTLAANYFVIPDCPPGSGVEKFLLILAAVSEQAREVRLADDPWTSLQLLRTIPVERWHILLNAHQQSVTLRISLDNP